MANHNEVASTVAPTWTIPRMKRELHMATQATTAAVIARRDAR